MSDLLVGVLGMLGEEDVDKKDAAVKCLEPLSTSSSDHWKAILDAGKTKPCDKDELIIV